MLRSAPGTVKLPIQDQPPLSVKTAKLPPCKKPAAPKVKWYPGRHLATITLKYCSTVGLIATGVLAKPTADWKPPSSKMNMATDLSSNTMDLDAITQKVYHKDSYGLQRQVVQTDLTGLDDDDAGGGKEERSLSPFPPPFAVTLQSRKKRSPSIISDGAPLVEEDKKKKKPLEPPGRTP